MSESWVRRFLFGRVSQNVGSQRVDRPENLPALLHRFHVQPEMTVKHHHDFNPVQRIQPDSLFPEKVGFIANVLGLEPFQRQVLDDEALELFLDLFERSIVNSTQRNSPPINF